MKALLLSFLFLSATAQAAEFTISVNKAGQVLTTSSDACPAGSLPARGQDLLKTGYQRLYQSIGDKYGASIDSDHFKMPNYDNRFLRAADQIQGGREVGHIEQQATAKNGLGLDDQGHQHISGLGVDGWTARYGAVSVSGNTQSDSNAYVGDYHIAALTSSSKSNITLSGDSETRPDNIAVLYCISY